MLVVFVVTCSDKVFTINPLNPKPTSWLKKIVTKIKPHIRVQTNSRNIHWIFFFNFMKALKLVMCDFGFYLQK